jgi:lysophospholipid acyltransferase (LPLAT)-like uncharacterized protein
VGAVTWLHYLAGCLAALVILLLRLSSRRRVLDDPRPALRAERRGYIYALLHAHQLSALVVNDDRRMAAMVSRSADGATLVPILRARRVWAVRGSSRSGGKDKGGRAALAELAAMLRSGVPALLAVDGPTGPRNHVRRGVVDLARDTGAAILPVVVVPSRRWILTRSWDRMQIPKPFATLRLAFGMPISVGNSESGDDVCARVSEAIDALERRYDPAEADSRHLARRRAPVDRKALDGALPSGPGSR